MSERFWKVVEHTSVASGLAALLALALAILYGVGVAASRVPGLVPESAIVILTGALEMICLGAVVLALAALLVGGVVVFWPDADE